MVLQELLEQPCEPTPDRPVFLETARFFIPELKRNVISVIDGVVRNGRNIDEALDYIDAKILVGVLRFDEDTCRACRRIWKDIESKAPRQRHKIGSDYNDRHKIYLD